MAGIQDWANRIPGWLALLPDAAVFLLGGAVLGLALWRCRLGGGRRASGSWACRSDLRKRGLLASRGLILGRWRRRGPLIRAAGDAHVLLAAPTRSGKGAGFVIPNLLDWPGSAVVLDVKGENYLQTSGYRAEHGQQVLLFDPESPDSCRWNPLHRVSRDAACQARDLQRLAAALYPRRTDAEAFWIQQARELFVGAAQFALETRGGAATFGQVRRFLDGPDLAGRICDSLAGDNGRSAGVSEGCANRLTRWASAGSEGLRAGILATAAERLLLWSEPLLERATSASDFRLAELRRQRISLYLRVSPGALTRLAPVLRLLLEELLQVNAEGLPALPGEESVPVLLLLDEFPALGRIPALERAIAYMAGYGIRCCIVAQSEAQLQAVYGEVGARTLIENCAVRLHFAPRSSAEAAQLSAALGTVLVPQFTRQRSTAPFAAKAGSVSTTLAERPILSAAAARTMNPAESVLLLPGCPPVRARKLRWWLDREFRDRRRPPVRQASGN